MMDYPTRPPYFSQRFIRLMVKSATAQTIGTDGFALLTIIATTEDARRYTGPVAFFNEQLMMLLGFGSKKRLVAARDRAMMNGWLIYRPGSKGVAGMYHVNVPEAVIGIPDGPSDETDSDLLYRSDSEPQTERQTEQQTKMPFRNGTKRERKRNGNGTPYIPSPIPTPIEKRPKCVAPTIEAVSTYARERKSSIDPNQFFDFYAANGWTQGRGKPIRDWKAAFRTWERNGLNKPSQRNVADDIPDATAERVANRKAVT